MGGGISQRNTAKLEKDKNILANCWGLRCRIALKTVVGCRLY